MRRIFSFSYMATNIFMLLGLTMSYICFPILAFITVHTFCTLIGMASERTRFSAATAVLIVGIYSLVGLVLMYIYYFKNRRSDNA